MCYEIRCSLQNWKNGISIFLCRKQLHSQAPAASRSFRISVPAFRLREFPFQSPREGVIATVIHALKTSYSFRVPAITHVVMSKQDPRVQLCLKQLKSLILQTYVADCFDKCLVCADFSFLERGDAGSNPGDKSKLLPPAHLIPSLKAEI